VILYNLPNSKSCDFNVSRAPDPYVKDEEELCAEYGDFAGYRSDGSLWFVTGVAPELCGEHEDPCLDNGPSRDWAEYTTDELGIQDSVRGYLSREPRDSILRVTGEQLYEKALKSEEINDPKYRFDSHEGGGKARVTEA
jgi:hypothetical protein